MYCVSHTGDSRGDEGFRVTGYICFHMSVPFICKHFFTLRMFIVELMGT